MTAESRRRPSPGLVVIVLTALALTGCASPPAPPPVAALAGPLKTPNVAGETGDWVANAAVQVIETSDPHAPTPRFDVVAQRTNDRPDKMTTYYVVAELTDTTVEGLKDGSRRLIRALARNNGGPSFTAYIWDRKEAAKTAVSYRTNPDLFSGEMVEAGDSFNSRHLIANYVGGLSSANEPPAYVLFWFPEAWGAGTERSRWVSAEVWKP